MRRRLTAAVAIALAVVPLGGCMSVAALDMLQEASQHRDDPEPTSNSTTNETDPDLSPVAK